METLKLFRLVAIFLFLFYFCVTAQREIECNGRDFQCEDSMRFITCVYLTDGQKLFKFDKCANGTFCNEENRSRGPCGDSQAVAKSTISTAPTSTADPATTLKESTTVPYLRATTAPGYNTTDLSIVRVNSTNGFSANSNVQISANDSNAGNMAFNVSTLMSLESPLTLKSSSIITWYKDDIANKSTKLNDSPKIETNTTVERLSDTPKMGSILISTLTQAFFSLTQFKSQSVVTFTNRNTQQLGLDPSPVSVNVANGFDSFNTNNMSIVTNTTISFGDPPPMPEPPQIEEVVEDMTVDAERGGILLNSGNLKALRGLSRFDIIESDFEDASLNTSRSKTVTEIQLPEEGSVDEVQFSSLASAVSKQDPTQTDYVAEEATEPFDAGINIADESIVEPTILADNTSYAGNIGEIYIKTGHTSVYDAEPTQNEDPHFPFISPLQNDFTVPDSTIRIDISNDTNKGLEQTVTTELNATASTDALDEEFFDFDDATRKAKLPSLRTTDNPGITVTSNYLGRNVKTQIEPTVLPILADGSKLLNSTSKDNETVNMTVNSPSPMPAETRNGEVQQKAGVVILTTLEPQTVKSWEFRTPAAINLEMDARPDWTITEVIEDTTEAATTVMEHTAPADDGELISTDRIESFSMSDRSTIPVYEGTTVTYLVQNGGNNQQFLPRAERTDVEEPLKNAAGATVSPNWPSMNSMKTHPAISETTFAGLSTKMATEMETTTAQDKKEIYEIPKEQVMIPVEGKGIPSTTEVLQTSSETTSKQNTEPTQMSTASSAIEIIEEFTCPSHGVFADKNDCRQYYLCIQQLVGYVKLPIFCSPRFSFDPISQRCVRDISNCSPEKCQRQGNFTDSSDETSYFECKEVLPGVFHKYHEQCAAPLKFISSLNRCGIANETGDRDREKTTTGTTVLIEHRYEEMPATTNKFEKSLVESFPVNEDHHMLGEAGNQKSQATENPKSSKRTVRSLSRVVPFVFKCNETGLFPHETDCKKYYMCIESIGNSLMRTPGYCPSRYAFHPESRYCSRDLSVCTSLKCHEPGNFPDPDDETRFYRCVPNSTGGYRIYLMDHKNRPGSTSTVSSRPVPASLQPTQITAAPTYPSPAFTPTTRPPSSFRPPSTHLEPSPGPFNPSANQPTSSVGPPSLGSPSGVSHLSPDPYGTTPIGPSPGSYAPSAMGPTPDPYGPSPLEPSPDPYAPSHFVPSPDPYAPSHLEPSPDPYAPSHLEPSPDPYASSHLEPSPDPYAPSHLEPSPDPYAPSYLEPSPDPYAPSHLEPSPDLHRPSHLEPSPNPYAPPHLEPSPDPYGPPSYGPSPVDPQHSVDPVRPVSPARPMPSLPTRPPPAQPTHPIYSTRPSPAPSRPVPTSRPAPASWSVPPHPVTTPRPITLPHTAIISRPSFAAPESRPTRPPYTFGTTLSTSPQHGYPAYPSHPAPTARPAQPDPAVGPPQLGPAVRPPQLGPAVRPPQSGPAVRPPQSVPAARPPQSIPAAHPPQSGLVHRPTRPEYSPDPSLPPSTPPYRPEHSSSPPSPLPPRPNRPFARPTTFAPPTRPSHNTVRPTRPVYFFGPDYDPVGSVNPSHSIDPSYNPDPAGPDFAYGFGHGPSFSQSNFPSRPGSPHVPNFAAGPDPDFFPDPTPYGQNQRWRRSTLVSNVDESETGVKQSTVSSQFVVDENYRRMAELQLRKIVDEMRRKAKEQSDYEERKAYLDILNTENKRVGPDSESTFSCSTTGRFADPKNCKRYFICSQKEDGEFKMFDLKCRGSDKFDYRKRICVEEEDAHCA